MMMEEKNAVALVTYMTVLLKEYLEDLSEVADTRAEQFLYGEKIAYIECLEILQGWMKKDAALDNEIERKYRLWLLCAIILNNSNANDRYDKNAPLCEVRFPFIKKEKNCTVPDEKEYVREYALLPRGIRNIKLRKID